MAGKSWRSPGPDWLLASFSSLVPSGIGFSLNLSARGLFDTLQTLGMSQNSPVQVVRFAGVVRVCRAIISNDRRQPSSNPMSQREGARQVCRKEVQEVQKVVAKPDVSLSHKHNAQHHLFGLNLEVKATSTLLEAQKTIRCWR